MRDCLSGIMSCTENFGFVRDDYCLKKIIMIDGYIPSEKRLKRQRISLNFSEKNFVKRGVVKRKKSPLNRGLFLGVILRKECYHLQERR